jgi:hypothetical protein
VTFLYFARVPFVAVFVLFVLIFVVLNWRNAKSADARRQLEEEARGSSGGAPDTAAVVRGLLKRHRGS